MWWTPDRMYSRRELAIRVILSVAFLVLVVGLRFHNWGLIPWLVPAAIAIWIVDLYWLRSRGQIGPPNGESEIRDE